ncbi:MAG: SHOCT domain-containing protein [Acidimicrobiales bacterium]
MAFPRRLLTEGEEVVVELHPHWSSLGWPLPVAVAVTAGAVAVGVHWPHAPIAVGYVLLGAVVLAGAVLGARLLRWRNTLLVLTTTRLVERRGVFGRRGLDVRLERLNEISYHQTIGGRILRTGELLVELGGERGVVVFDHVRRPAALASLVHEQIAASGQRAPMPLPPLAGAAISRPRTDDDTPPAGTRSPGPTGDLTRQLVELDELRRRGILSEAEFAAKKAELLDRL